MPHLRIMTWNIYQLPGTTGDQLARLEPTLGHVARYADVYDLDVVVLTEVFKEEAFAAIRARLAGPGQRFAFLSPRPEGAFGGINDGGVVVLARAGASLAFVRPFQVTTGIDGFATKGAVGVRVDKAGQRFLVCGTHLQASYGTVPVAGGDVEAPYRATRRRQFDELMGWAGPARSGRRLILAGDLNVDAGAAGTAEDGVEWRNLLARAGLHAASGWYPQTPLRDTYDPASNTLARLSCGGDLRKRLLDHVLFEGPAEGTLRWITHPETPSAWRPPAWVSLARTDARGVTTRSLASVIFHDLSDHFPTFLEMRL